MRVAAIYDIHGNLPALEATLDAIARQGVDQVVVGGDVTLGPMPRETLLRLQELDVPTRFLQGNCDQSVLAEMTGANSGYNLPEQVQAAVRWTARQLGADHARWFASWPKTIRVSIPELGEVLFCHATPRNENELFTRSTAEERLLPVFDGLDVSLVVCGHTHMPFDRMVGSTRVVNAGSVGMPFGEPGAHWLLLGPGVQFRRTPYDLAGAAARFRDTDYPQADSFARDTVQPRSEREMLALFAKRELR